jgi:hypothetical protein
MFMYSKTVWNNPLNTSRQSCRAYKRFKTNVSQYIEESFTPTGIWSSPDLTRLSNAKLSLLSTYLVSYRPPASSTGSCHGIKVQVSRHHATVYARDEYCNTRHPISEPLDGTRLGREMQEYADFGEGEAIPVYVQARAFAENAVTSRVHVAIEFEPSAIKRKWERVNLYATVAVLGMVRDKTGKVVARFSDMNNTAPWNFYRGPLPPDRNFLKSWEMAGIPGRYETQMQLTAGEYTLEVVVTDGEKFGKAKIPVRVEQWPQSTVSDIVLCKRFHLWKERRPPGVRRSMCHWRIAGWSLRQWGDMRFDRNQPLIAYFELYEGVRNGNRAGNFRIRIADGKTAEVKTGHWTERSGNGTGSQQNCSHWGGDGDRHIVAWRICDED